MRPCWTLRALLEGLHYGYKKSNFDAKLWRVFGWIRFRIRVGSIGVYNKINYIRQHLLTYLLTYLHTPWCRVLLEELTGLQLVKKFPAFHGTRKFITALTSVRQLSLSWANTIQSIYPHPTSWRSILILSTHLRLGLPSIYVSTNFYNLYIRLHVSTHSSSGLHSRQSH